jgi:hypothetical protein
MAASIQCADLAALFHFFHGVSAIHADIVTRGASRGEGKRFNLSGRRVAVEGQDPSPNRKDENANAIC